MKKKRGFSERLNEHIVFEQIVSFIFDQKSGVMVCDTGHSRLGLFSRLDKVLCPIGMQQLLVKVEAWLNVKVENSEIFQDETISGLPGVCFAASGLSDSPYRVKTFFSFSRLLLNKI